MPFVAYIKGEKVRASSFSDSEWNDITRELREDISYVMLDCGNPALTSKSVLGNKFFRHWPQIECTESHTSYESEAHLSLKEKVAKRLEKLKWSAEIEKRLPSGRIADVFGSKDGKKVAFEIQLSPQAAVDYDDRTRDYHSDGVSVYWISIRKISGVVDSQVAYFIEPNKLVYEDEEFTLAQFIRRAVRGKLKVRSEEASRQAHTEWSVPEEVIEGKMTWPQFLGIAKRNLDAGRSDLNRQSFISHYKQ